MDSKIKASLENLTNLERNNGSIDSQNNIAECIVCCQSLQTDSGLQDSNLAMCYDCVDDFTRTKPAITMSVIHQCGSCNVCFMGEGDLRDHVKEKHSGEDVETKARLLVHETPNLDPADEDEPIETQDDTTESQTRDENKELPIGKQKTCPICKNNFSKDTDLQMHIRIHLGQEPSFTCRFCDEGFAVLSYLKRHEQTHTTRCSPPHYTGKSHQCKFCNRGFAKSSNLRRHEWTHTGEKPYKCKFCSRHFARTTHLKRHEKTHTGEKTHECKICGRRFADPAELIPHNRVHTGEKPYVCEVCGKAFTVCGALNRHQRIHTGEKPFSCNVCHKGFSYKHGLTTHERTHTGDTPFRCDFCHKRFTTKSALRKHLRNLH